MESKTRYYELCYFRGRKDNGSIYIKTELLISDYVEEDDFLLDLVNRRELDSAQVDSIMDVRAISRETYEKYSAN